MLKKLGKKLIHNLGLKILAAAFAFMLWVVVINVDEPMRTVPYTASVKTENEDYITSNGKYFELLDGNNTVTFNVTAKRTYQEKLTNADFTAIADMERIQYVDDSGVYRVPVSVSCSKFSSNQVTISSKQLYIEVAMEDRGSIQKRITAVTVGNVADGCAVGSVDIISTNLLKISGPSSVTSQIDTVEAAINVEGMSSDVTDTVLPVLYDVDKNVIDPTKLSMNLSTVTIRAKILKTKDVELEFHTAGTPAEGYVIKEIQYSPRTVRIKGETAALNATDKIEIPAEMLNVAGLTEDMEREVDITSYLTEGTSLVLASDATVSVTVKVERMIKGMFDIPVSALTVENLSENKKIIFPLEHFSAEIAGAESDMAKLSAEDIKGTIDLSGLGNGEHTVEVTLLLDEKLYQLTAAVTIPVNVEDKDTAGTEDEAGISDTEKDSENLESGGNSGAAKDPEEEETEAAEVTEATEELGEEDTSE